MTSSSLMVADSAGLRARMRVLQRIEANQRRQATARCQHPVMGRLLTLFRVLPRWFY
jgi:hypothetical protein